MHKRDLVAVGSWIGISFVLWVIAWIIAEAVPVFSDLLSLIVCFYLAPMLQFFLLATDMVPQTALFGSWFTFGFTGMFGLHMSKGMWLSSTKHINQTLLNTFSICVGVILVSFSLGKTLRWAIC